MANRNSTALVLPGNPLGSVLRETARQARRSTRDPNATDFATAADVAALQAQVTTLQSSNTTLQSQVTALQNRVIGTVLTTGAGGLGTWTFPTPFVNVPVIVATPLGGAPYHCNIVGPTNAATQFIVFDAGGAGLAGVNVNLVAFSRD